MSVLEGLFQQYLEIAQDVLGNLFGEELVGNILAAIAREYRALAQSEETRRVTPTDINQKMHIVTPCFVIALHRALQGHALPNGSPSLREIMMSIFRALVGPLAGMQASRLQHAPNPWHSFAEATIFSTENTYSFFVPEVARRDEDALVLHLHRCVYWDVFSAHDEQEIAPILCEYDEIFAGAVAEWVTFSRPETIASGGEKCTFSYRPRA